MNIAPQPRQRRKLAEIEQASGVVALGDRKAAAGEARHDTRRAGQRRTGKMTTVNGLPFPIHPASAARTTTLCTKHGS